MNDRDTDSSSPSLRERYLPTSRDGLNRIGFLALMFFVFMQFAVIPAAAVDPSFICSKVMYDNKGNILTYPNNHPKNGPIEVTRQNPKVTVEYPKKAHKYDFTGLTKHIKEVNKMQKVTVTYEDAEYKRFVQTLRNIIGVLMVMGPVMGILIYLFASVAQSAQFGGDGGGTNYTEARRDAIVYGFGVPVAAYALEVLSSAILGLNFGCIVP